MRQRYTPSLLRSNQTDWDAEAMWRTYIMLTDLEAVFRSLKSELGLCPIYHQTQERSNGHLFITVLAYQLMQVIRRRLREQRENRSWSCLREILAGQQRVTVSFRRAAGSTLHVRKATVAVPEQRALYDALGVDAAPRRGQEAGGSVVWLRSLRANVVPHATFRIFNVFTYKKITFTLLNLG